MISNKYIAKKTAKQLLKINAVSLKQDDAFTWASGMKSPIYCDNRIILSYPETRNKIRDFFCETIKEKYPKAEMIAGVATGAIAIGALVADTLELPFIYVRPKPKGHGQQNQIEGQIQEGKNVVVIEDLISTGMSSMNAIKALQRENINLLGMLAIFSYDFEQSSILFSQENIEFFTLSDYNYLLEEAINQNYISRDNLDNLKQWRDNPKEWQSINNQ